MKSRRRIWWPVAVLAATTAGCANSDSVTTSEIALIESYAVDADDRTLEVSMTAGCGGLRLRVFASETADTVKLLGVMNTPGCGSDNGDIGYVNTAVVVLDGPLGDREVVDAGCEFVLAASDCLPLRKLAPSDA